MSLLSTADIQKIAQLSGLYLTEAELEKYQGEFEEILGYVRQLDDVDVTGLEPTYQVTGLKNITRPDQIIDYGLSRQQLLANAHRQRDGSIEVPKVL